MPPVTDEEQVRHLIALTAEFRFGIRWRGARLLLEARGLLIAQARIEGASFLSADPVVASYPVQVIW